jgi:hypothetical protein
VSTRVGAALVIAALSAIMASIALGASKGGDSFIGQVAPVTGAAADGGLFNGPADTAVDQDSGDIFVVDQKLHRIQRLSADGDFELAWGRDVIAPGAGTGFEVCTVAADCQAGSSGGLGGELFSPEGIAVDQDTGHVFVTDRDNLRVQEFSFDGGGLPVFERAWGWDVIAPGPGTGFEVCTTAADCKQGVAGSGAGQLGATSAVSGGRLDVSKDGAPGTGQVIVADTGNHRIQMFDYADLAALTPPSGSEIFGVNVSGTGDGKFTDESPEHVAIDEDGVVYARDVSDGSLERYDTTTGTFLAPLLNLNQFHPGPGGNVQPYGLEVDPVSGNLLSLEDKVGGLVATRETVVMEFANPGASTPPDAAESLHMEGSGDQDVDGLGVSRAGPDDKLLVSGRGGFLGQRIVVLDSDGAGPMTLLPTTPVDVLGPNDALFEGSVNPSPDGPTGFATTYRFEYTEDPVGDDNWIVVPGSPLTDPDANLAQEVSAPVSALEANTAYRMRITAVRTFAHAIRKVSSDVTFVTAQAPPVVTTLDVTNRGERSARLLGRVNPQNTDTDWHFEYIADDEFQSDGWANATSTPTEVAQGGTARLVSADVGGLEPNTLYRYRLVATNGVPVDPDCDPEVTECDVDVEGAELEFRTRVEVDEPAGRGYEMVTAPEKGNRRGEDGRTPVLGVPGAYGVGGLPSPDGEALLFGVFGTILDPESGNDSAHMTGWEVRRRTDTGWTGDAVNNIPTVGPGRSAINQLIAISADLRVSAWRHLSSVFPSGSRLGTKVMRDTGGIEGRGWYPWLLDQGSYPWLPADPPLVDHFTGADRAIAGEDLMLRWGDAATGEGAYYGLLGPDDPSLSQTAGAAPYRVDATTDWLPRELVSECTGAVGSVAEESEEQLVSVTATGGDFTLTFDGQTTGSMAFGTSPATVRSRLEALSNLEVGDVQVTGSAGAWTVRFIGTRLGWDVPQMTIDDDLLTGPAVAASVSTARQGAPVSATSVPVRYATGTIGGRPCVAGEIPSVRGAIPGGFEMPVTAVTGDGSRMFLTSPDPDPAFSPPTCTSDSYADTICPAQLFVRQYDSGGTPALRWISRSEVAGQADGLMRHAVFEGASTDGRVVFFRTNQPLVASDPNGGDDIVTGTASESSNDLYRYELPASRDDDPTGPEAGGLTRITGGPDGTADPNTNGIESTGRTSAARYISDDGRRVYFVTRAPISGADNTSPAGSTTAPGGGVAQDDTRNLYLYDSEDDSYKFVARVPYGEPVPNPDNGDACLSTYAIPAPTRAGSGQIRHTASCVRGTSTGEAIIFESAEQLTQDDTDAGSDIYMYDAGEDELVRLSAPREGQTPYACAESNSGQPMPDVTCNAELGWLIPDVSPISIGGLAGVRHHNLSENPDGSLRAVYFQSRHALDPEDTNGMHWDTYEWREGIVTKISPGDSSDHAFYAGNSLDGEDVFFHTTQRIDAREIDESDGDVYDARRGGGFPDPPAPPVPCDPVADQCRGSGPGGTGVVDGGAGPGNFDGVRGTVTVRSLSAKARKRAARSGVLRLRVVAGKAGILRAVARARIGGRRRIVGRGRATAARKGVVSLRVKLSASARKQLRRGRKVTVSVEVRMPDTRKGRAKFVLRRAGK